MKFTIAGFAQQAAIDLGLDFDDLIILRWFIDFKNTGKMYSMIIDNERYYWVDHQTVADELIILRMKKDTIYRRLKKMCEKKILKRQTVQFNCKTSFYALGENFAPLEDFSFIEEFLKSRNQSCTKEAISKGTTTPGDFYESEPTFEPMSVDENQRTTTFTPTPDASNQPTTTFAPISADENQLTTTFAPTPVAQNQPTTTFALTPVAQNQPTTTFAPMSTDENQPTTTFTPTSDASNPLTATFAPMSTDENQLTTTFEPTSDALESFTIGSNATGVALKPTSTDFYSTSTDDFPTSADETPTQIINLLNKSTNESRKLECVHAHSLTSKPSSPAAGKVRQNQAYSDNHVSELDFSMRIAEEPP